MAYRSLEINEMSAKDLKKVNLIGKMLPYVVVSIPGDPRGSQQQRTAVDRSGNASPAWNFPLMFFVEESAPLSNRPGVKFRIRCERTLGDKDIGEVHVPLSELIREDGELRQSITYQVRRPSGKLKGELNFSYKWEPKMASAPYPAQVGPSPDPPPPQPGYPYQYPPPQPGYPYQYPPPQPGYENLPPRADYGYPAVGQPLKNNWWAKFLGLEAVKIGLDSVIPDDFSF